MPKFQQKPTSVFAWLFLSIPFGLLIWLFWLYPISILFVPIYIAISVWEEKRLKRHFVVLLKDRQKDSICSFSRHFKSENIDTWIIRAVYEQLQDYLKSEIENFPVRATDDVFTDLQFDEEEFEYRIVEEIAQRSGRSLENAELNPYYGKANIVENLVFFFNEQPQTNAT